MEMYTGDVSGPLQSKVCSLMWPLYQVGLAFHCLLKKQNKHHHPPPPPPPKPYSEGRVFSLVFLENISGPGG